MEDNVTLFQEEVWPICSHKIDLNLIHLLNTKYLLHFLTVTALTICRILFHSSKNASLSSSEKASRQKLPLVWRKAYIRVTHKHIQRENSTENPKFSFEEFSTNEGKKICWESLKMASENGSYNALSISLTLKKSAAQQHWL